MQKMLNALRTYCSKWRMFVNTGKTKVMILNKKEGSTSSVDPVFTYDGVELEIVSDFKYLGVIFSVHI